MPKLWKIKCRQLWKIVYRLHKRPAFRVTSSDMVVFDEDTKNLPLLIIETIDDFCKEMGFAKRVNSQIADMCRTDEKTFREYLSGKRRITRQFLYKFTIGLSLSLEKADELFQLCGGKLEKTHNREDFIVATAIEDGDEIDEFIENFNEFSLATKLR